VTNGSHFISEHGIFVDFNTELCTVKKMCSNNCVKNLLLFGLRSCVGKAQISHAILYKQTGNLSIVDPTKHEVCAMMCLPRAGSDYFAAKKASA
jgi:hypothetical protein